MATSEHRLSMFPHISVDSFRNLLGIADYTQINRSLRPQVRFVHQISHLGILSRVLPHQKKVQVTFVPCGALGTTSIDQYGEPLALHRALKITKETDEDRLGGFIRDPRDERVTPIHWNIRVPRIYDATIRVHPQRSKIGQCAVPNLGPPSFPDRHALDDEFLKMPVDRGGRQAAPLSQLFDAGAFRSCPSNKKAEERNTHLPRQPLYFYIH